jgi:hypothetical protein
MEIKPLSILMFEFFVVSFFFRPVGALIVLSHSSGGLRRPANICRAIGSNKEFFYFYQRGHAFPAELSNFYTKNPNTQKHQKDKYRKHPPNNRFFPPEYQHQYQDRQKNTHPQNKTCQFNSTSQ